MSIFSKIGNWIGGLFKKASDALENTVLPIAINVTNALKLVVDTDSPDIIGHIAGAAGAQFEDKVRSILTGLIPKLQLAQQFKGQDPGVILASVLKLVGNADGITKSAFWIEFSGMLAHAFEDGKIDLGEAMALAKYFYENHSDAQPPAAS